PVCVDRSPRINIPSTSSTAARSTPRISYPCDRSSFAVAFPIPEAAPVTTSLGFFVLIVRTPVTLTFMTIYLHSAGCGPFHHGFFHPVEGCSMPRSVVVKLESIHDSSGDGGRGSPS